MFRPTLRWLGRLRLLVRRTHPRTTWVRPSFRTERALIGAAVLASLLTASLADRVSGDCIDYATFIHRVGYLSGLTGYDAYTGDVVVSGTYAYVTGANPISSVGSVLIIDVSDPASPTLLNTVGLPKRAWGLAISGSYLYVATDQDGLRIFSISNPTSPTLVGSIDTPGSAYDVAISDPYAYVVDWHVGLQVVDVSNPASPSMVGSVNTPGLASAVSVSGSNVFLAGESAGLEAIDVSNPMTPNIVGTLSTPVNAHGVTVSGNHAYLAEFEFGLRIVDVTNPASLAIVGSVRTPASSQSDYGPHGVTVDGSHAFVADGYGGLQVIDISDPGSPRIVGGVPAGGRSVAISGPYAYVAGGGLTVIDISNRISPPFVGRAGVRINDLTVTESYAYVAGDGLQVLDISDPGSPTVLGTTGWPIQGGAGVAVSGSYAYLTEPYAYDPDFTHLGQLRIIDISNPAAPTLVASVNSTGGRHIRSRGIAVSGDFVYVACPDGGLSDPGHLQVVDVSRPTRPSTVATVPVPEFPCYSVAISGSYAYVTGFKQTIPTYPVRYLGFTTGVRVIDISNPASPVIVGSLTLSVPNNNTTPASAWFQLAVAGNYVYVVGYPGLQVIDVSNPASPSIVATNLGAARGVAIQGSEAYVAGEGTDFRVVDIQNPLSPTTKGFGHLSISTSAVATNASYLFVSGTLIGDLGPNGPFIFPLQCSSNPPTDVHLSSFQAFPQPGAILLEWATSVESDFSGFHVQRSLEPGSDFRQLSTQLILPPSPYRFLDAGVTPGMTYYYRLEALDRSGTREFFGPISARPDPGTTLRPLLGQSEPNPFAGSAVTIPFVLAQAGDVQLRILDLSGGQVRLLVNQRLEAGKREMLWDGRNDRGELVSAGMYLYQLEASGFRATGRMVKLR